MPKTLGTKHREKRQKALEEEALKRQILAAEPEQILVLAKKLAGVRSEKRGVVDSVPEDEFSCAFHISKNDGRTFQSKERDVYVVSEHYKYDKNGELILEERFGRTPCYLVACGGCEKSKGISDHLTED